MKKNRRNNSRPAAIATAKDTTRCIERGRRREERSKDKLLSSVYG